MRYLLSLSLLVLAFIANARQITPDEAQAVAQDFFNNSSIEQSRAPRAIRARALNSTPSEENAPYYIFNASDNNGFVIISGDDRAKKILGYSDKGSFDTQNIPPQVKYLLDLYSNQIKNISEFESSNNTWTQGIANTQTEQVNLQTAEWGQMHPFNSLCPTVDDEYCVTGCVATAMAIVMRYNEWPINGRGEHHYDWRCQSLQTGNTISQTFEVNFLNSVYEYGSMPLTSSFSSDKEINSVAKLMFDAAVSVDMSFAPDASGASIFNVSHSLREYFKYDMNCQLISRMYFNEEEWGNIIISQLKEQHPIIYSGNNDNSIGHAWVIDGYDPNSNCFHCNFGWNGNSNGYYSLDINSSLGFPNDQGMIINIIPDRGPREYSRAYVEAPYLSHGFNKIDARGLNISTSEIQQNVPFDINVTQLILPSEFSGRYGYAIVDSDDNVKELIWSSDKESVLYGRVLVPPVAVIGAISKLSSQDLKPTDRLQVVTKYENENIWRIVPGTLEAPSSCPVHGYEPVFTTISIDLNDDLILYLSSDHYLNYECRESDRVNSESYNSLRGIRVDFRIVPKSLNNNKILTFDIDGYFNGEYMNRVRTTVFTKDEVCGFFECTKPEIKLSANYIDKETFSIKKNLAGDLSNYVNVERAKNISNLTIEGPLNIYDMWYINDYFQSLQSIDISKTYFVGTELKSSEIFSYNTILSKHQPDNFLPETSFFELKRLESVKLPHNINQIGGLCFFQCYGIQDIEIPKDIENIYGSFLFECVSLKNIKSFCSIPPKFSQDFGNFWEPTFSTATLFVPNGTSTLYKNSPVWNKFVNIVEFDPAGIDDINIDYSTTPKDIYDIHGRCIKLNATELDINALTPGLYIIGNRKVFIGK